MIKTITCRAGNATWELVRLDETGWKYACVPKNLAGHPAYWRPLHNPDVGEDAEFTLGYEVWPRPAEHVEVTPILEPEAD